MQSIGTLLQRNFTIRDIMWATVVICLVVTWRLDVRRMRFDIVRLEKSYLQRIWDANFEAEQAHKSLLEFEQTGYPGESSKYRLALKAVESSLFRMPASHRPKDLRHKLLSLHSLMKGHPPNAETRVYVLELIRAALEHEDQVLKAPVRRSSSELLDAMVGVNE